MMKNIFPQYFSIHRAKKIRSHIYNVAGKLVKTGRKLILKLSQGAADFISKVVTEIRQFDPPAPAT